MIGNVLKRVFGTSHEREIKRIRPRVERINALEDSLKKLSDADLRGKTVEFKQKLDRGATLDELLEERAQLLCMRVHRLGEALERPVRLVGIALEGGLDPKTGRASPMPLTAWRTYLMTNPTFGYDRSPEALQRADEFIQALHASFGLYHP